ncbi:hypothetical protein GR252_35825 [Rhizobium leguminosarum]|nr:hypothetical protein [Rhizobium leguminosarum]
MEGHPHLLGTRARNARGDGWQKYLRFHPAPDEVLGRNKKMSKIGVRNIDGFNTRVEQALSKGEAISRTVQTGFDRHTDGIVTGQEGLGVLCGFDISTKRRALAQRRSYDPRFGRRP